MNPVEWLLIGAAHELLVRTWSARDASVQVAALVVAYGWRGRYA